MRIQLSILLVYIFCCCKQVGAQSGVQDYLVVSNNSGLADTVTLKETNRIFQAKYTRWPKTGAQVTIVLPSSKHPHANAIARLLYNGTFRDMQKFWLLLVFQGRFAPPVFQDSDREILEYIENNPGSTGVIFLGSQVKGVKSAKASYITK